MLSNILLHLMGGLLALSSVSSKCRWGASCFLGWSYVFFQVFSTTVSQPKTHKRSWYNFLPDSRDCWSSFNQSQWQRLIYIYRILYQSGAIEFFYNQVYKHELNVIWNRFTNGIGSALVIFYDVMNFRARAQVAGPALGWARLSSWPTQMIKGEARVLEVK